MLNVNILITKIDTINFKFIRYTQLFLFCVSNTETDRQNMKETITTKTNPPRISTNLVFTEQIYRATIP